MLSLADLVRGAEEAGTRDQDLRAHPAILAAHRNAEMQIGIDLDSLDRTDEAKKHLEKPDRRAADDMEAIMALANILRERKQYRRMRRRLRQGDRQHSEPEQANWVIFYFRGICFERSKHWPQAEADFKRALRALSRPAAGAQLSRLFLDRPGRPSRRGHEHDQALRRAAARRRLHRRLARLGLLPARQL